jgi:trans-aconitate 2-methyltransferase
MDTWDPALYQEKHAFVWKYGQELVGLLEPRPGERRRARR